MIQAIENGNFAEDAAWLLRAAATALYAQRVKFYPDKDYGSRLLELRPCDSVCAASLARQAVNNIDGVYVKSAIRTENGWEFILAVNNEERQVFIDYGRYL